MECTKDRSSTNGSDTVYMMKLEENPILTPLSGNINDYFKHVLLSIRPTGGNNSRKVYWII